MAPADTITTGTISFVNESSEANVVSTSPVEHQTSYLGDDISHDSADYFSRYRLVGSVTNADRTILNVKDFMLDDQFRFRLAGSMGVKGIFKFKLTWNTDPMIQGLYMMTYLPPLVRPHIRQTNKTWHNFYSGCDHVLVNLSKESSAELILPYVGETSYIPTYDCQKYAQQVGTLVITAISPAKANTSPVNIKFNVYFALDKAEMFGTKPTLASVQSGIGIASVAEAIKKSKLVSSATSSIANWLNSSDNPSLVSKTASWALGGVSKISDMLGWSKPMNVSNLHPVVNLNYHDIVSSDATFTGVKLANNVDAGIAPLDMGGNNLDELSFKNLFRRKEFWRSINVSKSQTSGTSILNEVISPDTFMSEETTTAPDGTYNFRAYNRIGYMSTLFKKWRGSLNIKMVPVATRFHSMRIRVVFYVDGTEAQAYANMSYTYSTVVDIDDPSTWEFTIPFISQNPWRDTRAHDIEERLGMSIFVENALIAPDNVADNIDLVFFMSGGDDLEFSELHRHNTQDYEAWLFSLPIPNPALKEVPTSNEASTSMDDLLPSVQSSMTPQTLALQKNKSVEAHSAAVGDPIRSLRSVLKRFTYSFDSSRNFIFGMVTPIMPSNTYRPADVMSKIAAMFAFYRGSIRYFVNSYYPIRVSLLHEQVPKGPFNNGFTDVIEHLDWYSRQYVHVPASVGEATKIEVPYYANVKQINMWQAMNDISNGIDIENTSRLGLGVYFDFYLGNQNAHIMRAGGDDFDLGFMVGAPALLKFVPAA